MENLKLKFKKSIFNIVIVPKIFQHIETLENDIEYEITINKIKKKRSLDANAYFWVLCDKLAAATNTAKVEIYKSYIKNIGGNNEVVCVLDKAVDKLVSGWEHNGIGWQTNTTESKIDGCTNVILYYGSSTYDSKQMARLIDFAVQDCKAIGIETATPEEVARMTELWGKNE